MYKSTLIFVSVFLFCSNGVVNADKILAHSKSLKMSFTAKGDPWCKPGIVMDVTAQDESKFKTSEYITIVQKLGQVLTHECSQANSVFITAKQNGRTVWTGTAAKANKWLAKKKENVPINTVSKKEKIAEKIEKETTPKTKLPVLNNQDITSDKNKNISIVKDVSQNSLSGVTFPDCKTMFKWGGEGYEADKHLRGREYVGGISKGKYLLSGLRDENLVPVYGLSIDKWTENELENWVGEYKTCFNSLKKATKKIKNKYNNPLYQLFSSGQRYFGTMLGMTRGGKDVFSYPQLIKHQIFVSGENKKAIELKKIQIEKAKNMSASNENILKLTSMGNHSLLKYLSAAEQRKHKQLLAQYATEMKKELLAIHLRAKHQENITQQYKLLSQASKYDQLRFYTSLMLAKSKLDKGKINFQSRQTYYQNPLANAVTLSHPAQFVDQVKNDTVVLSEPMYMLIKADDGEIEKPYSMVIETNKDNDEIDGWMLIKVGPTFGFKFYQNGKPVFNIKIEDSVLCKSDRCFEEMDASTMMKTWYNNKEIELSENKNDKELS